MSFIRFALVWLFRLFGSSLPRISAGRTRCRFDTGSILAELRARLIRTARPKTGALFAVFEPHAIAEVMNG